LGLDWVYLALPVAPGDVPDAIAGARALGLVGLSVTMPHKAAVAGAVHQLSPVAARLGAVNTVVRRGRALLGDSTDGDGFVAALRVDQGWEPEARTCVVLGAGGAARAVVLALAEAGAAAVWVVARRRDQALAAARLAGAAGEVVSADRVEAADLVVNATPVGMAGVGGDGAGRLPLGMDPARLGAGQLVVDLIYSPPSTPLLDAARSAGAATANGFGTLVHQAALQCRLWTGMDPPLAVMSAAGAKAAALRGGGDEEGEELGG
jgi:shikimate dehydrogenase